MKQPNLNKDGASAREQALRKRVILEPDLELVAGALDAPARRRLARQFYRWAKQLWTSAAILDQDAAPSQRPSLPKIAPTKLILN